MTTGSETQNNAGSEPRVYKHGQVHKRRATRQERKAWSAELRAAAQAAAGDDSVADGLARDDVADDSLVGGGPAHGDLVDGGAADDGLADGGPAVSGSVDGDVAAGDLAGENAAEENPVDDGRAEGGSAGDDERVAGSESVRPSVKGKQVAGTKPKRKRGKLIGALVAIVAVVAVAAGASFALNGADGPNDHADMQGEWYVAGTAVAVTIDDEYIHLTDDVSYAYAIDESNKTIQYTFGPMEGHGRYWFSDDRQSLVIEDDAKTDDASSARAVPATPDGQDETQSQGYAQTYTDFTVGETGTAVTLPQGNGLIAFTRQPNMDALAAKEAAERKAAAQAESEQEGQGQEAEGEQGEQGEQE